MERRAFLENSGRSLGGGWLALNLPLLGALSACAREAELNGEPLRVLTPREGRSLEAMAARLIPSGPAPDGSGTVGAREAGAVHFVDQALAGPFGADAGFLRAGFEALADAGFLEMSEAEQDAHLRAMEETPFFGFARFLVVMGTFSDPRHGGGRGDALHRIYGIEHAPGFEPPFGWYDGEGAGGEVAG